jgi:hypothetical protein
MHEEILGLVMLQLRNKYRICSALLLAFAASSTVRTSQIAENAAQGK